VGENLCNHVLKSLPAPPTVGTGAGRQVCNKRPDIGLPQNGFALNREAKTSPTHLPEEGGGSLFSQRICNQCNRFMNLCNQGASHKAPLKEF